MLATGVLDPPLLALEGSEDFVFPALTDRLDRSRREVGRRSVLEPGTQERVNVGMRGAALAAVLVDGENSLDAARRAAEGPVD